MLENVGHLGTSEGGDNGALVLVDLIELDDQVG
jgi:hypothetical protein